MLASFRSILGLGPTTYTVFPLVGPDVVDGTLEHTICDALEKSIALHEASVAAGKENPPPTLSQLDATKDCRIGRVDFDAVLAFEASHASLYAGAVPVVRRVPADAVPEGQPVPPLPAIHEGSDGKWYEPAAIFVELAVSQLFARWFALQKGMGSEIPWPKSDLRFKPGDRVECQVAPGCFATGMVVKAGRSAYIEINKSQPSPYRVKLDISEVDELRRVSLLPEGHDGYIHAPIDDKRCIRQPKS